MAILRKLDVSSMIQTSKQRITIIVKMHFSTKENVLYSFYKDK